MKLIKERLQQNWPWLFIIPLCIGYFLFSSSFNYLSQSKDFTKWMSPDETANYTVAKLYAETDNLAFFEKYNLIAKDIIHPRSFRSDYGLIKPVSFLGLPILYGKLAKLFGVGILPYLTPIIGIFGLIFFYLFVKRIFGKDNALIATILAAAFPIYTYYSARSMFHNVLFLAAFFAGLYFASRMSERNQEVKGYFKKNGFALIFSLCSGLFIGLAIAARSSELLWVGPLMVFVWLCNVRKIGLVRLFFFAYGVFIIFLPMLYWNGALYGSFFSSGYPELNDSLFSLQQGGAELANTGIAGKFNELRPIVAKIKATIFHFGYKPEQSYKLFNAYITNMFPWLFWSAAAGLLVLITFFKKYSKEKWIFLIAWVSASVLLILYYGSWTFFDNPDPNSFTIGNSYTRYWLPIYFGALPLASLALITATQWIRNIKHAWAIRFVALAMIVIISVQYVWNEPSEGLAVSIEKQAVAKTELRTILSLTEENSIIITRYHDKLLFPERKVVIGLFDDPNMIVEYANLARRVPVYYYNFSFKKEDLDYLNNGSLVRAGLSLSLVQAITDRFNLYKLNSLTTQ